MFAIAESKRDLGQDVTVALAKVAPAAAVAVAPAAQLGLQEWVFILTIVYLVLQISFLMWKWVASWLRARRVATAHPGRHPQDE